MEQDTKKNPREYNKKEKTNETIIQECFQSSANKTISGYNNHITI